MNKDGPITVMAIIFMILITGIIILGVVENARYNSSQQAALRIEPPTVN